jgi:hypothetical protein
MMTRYLLILLAVLLTSCLGAFFLFVTILPAVIVSLFIIMLCGMFWLGLYYSHSPRVLIRERYICQAPEWSFNKRSAETEREFRTAA